MEEASEPNDSLPTRDSGGLICSFCGALAQRGQKFVRCFGYCQRCACPDCAGPNSARFKCYECTHNLGRCIFCRVVSPVFPTLDATTRPLVLGMEPKDEAEREVMEGYVFLCCKRACGAMFHLACAPRLRFTAFYVVTPRIELITKNRNRTYRWRCPAHFCHRCVRARLLCAREEPQRGRRVKCAACFRSVHAACAAPDGWAEMAPGVSPCSACQCHAREELFPPQLRTSARALVHELDAPRELGASSARTAATAQLSTLLQAFQEVGRAERREEAFLLALETLHDLEGVEAILARGAER
eukprot:gnl/Chilomastix_cuspidata/5806.p1 GENE.gnl/Chilomastix_cuspidata/5806~~gnl/Chilomastix_cuspidata/5806.p1  ORF type:complete len:300 (-),score=116.40 gnl/Chilomastix_cuspidata/5806:646-1545(-)